MNKKEIDINALLKNSLTKAYAQHGILKEADAVPTLPLKSKLMGDKKEESYQSLSQILQPLRDAAGLPKRPSIDSLSAIIESLNAILGMSEEKIDVSGKKVGTGIMSNEKILKTDSASEILSSVYLYRTLYNVLKEQSAIVAGKVLEPVMAILFLGDTPYGDEIQDFFTAADEYVSLKVLATTEKITGSINNLALGIVNSETKSVTYIVCRKDQATEASKINVYKFTINQNNYLDFVCINESKGAEGFWKQNTEISETGKKFLSDVFGWNPATQKEIFDKLITNLLSGNEISADDLNKITKKEKDKEKEQLNEAYVDEVNTKEFDTAVLKACLLQDPFGLSKDSSITNYYKLFINNPENVDAALKDKDDKKLSKAAIEVAKKNRTFIKNSMLQGLRTIPTEVINNFNRICRFVFSKGREGKTRPDFINQNGEFDFAKYVEFIQSGAFPDDNANTLKIFNSAYFRKNLGDVNELLTFENLMKMPSVADVAERLNNIAFFDNEKQTTAADNDLYKRLDELKGKLTNKALESFFERPAKNVFYITYSRMESLLNAAKGELDAKFGKINPSDKTIFRDYIRTLEAEFNDRHHKYYTSEFRNLRQQILLSPFAPYFELREIIQSDVESRVSQVKQRPANVSDEALIAQRQNFINGIFQKTEIWTKNKRSGSFGVRLLDLPEKYGIQIEEVGTIFLNEKALFTNSERNAELFNKYMKPIYDNVTKIKEKSDQYFLKDDTNAMKDAVLTLKLLEDHINSELTTTGGEIKKGEELTEDLNLTNEAAIVMELLQRMED